VLPPHDQLSPAPLLALTLLVFAGLSLGAWAMTPDALTAMPESIPLRAAAVATPVRFPHTPPIHATPPFVSTEATPVFFSDWHRQTLMSWYLLPSPTPSSERSLTVGASN
jgi:hypothetical protein